MGFNGKRPMRIIKIGCNSFLIPAGMDVENLLCNLEELAEGTLETDYRDELRSVIYFKSRPAEIEIRVVEDRLVFDKKPDVKPEPAVPADEDIGRVAPVRDPHAAIGYQAGIAIPSDPHVFEVEKPV